MNKQSRFPYKLYLVLSEADCKGRHFLKVAEESIIGGVDLIQLREKNDDLETFIRKALQLKEITDNYEIPLIINDNLEIAKKVNATGIHVGTHDIPPVAIRELWCNAAYVGYSIEHLEQLDTEETAVSDYLGISPVFKTPTKTDTITEWGLDGIRTIRKLTDKPLVAIGNLDVHNIKSVIDAGADCIAVVSAICGAPNPQKAAYQLKNELLK
ncbi:thiamine phosphate synthase [Leeuwenhoekiella parthenopeia]|uniref:Thiamine-phosphate synthase n=1 Tax=Leeuwenhoekiella parthenopeia TaxID=2890320 RepID=A0ABS8GU67_9FLAO|nr:thiamine phosphate synthase [Leeuwenhoekiella parthenopeia]MCC4213205.1 thiamine phosphate synthase [Leeuwenhoekiella parthenopeia]